MQQLRENLLQYRVNEVIFINFGEDGDGVMKFEI